MSDESKRVPLESVSVGRRVRVWPRNPRWGRWDHEAKVLSNGGGVTVTGCRFSFQADHRCGADHHCYMDHGHWLAEILPDPPAAASEGPMHFVCPDCGVHVPADEDGCCAMCGADCTGAACRCAPAADPNPRDAEPCPRCDAAEHGEADMSVALAFANAEIARLRADVDDLRPFRVAYESVREALRGVVVRHERITGEPALDAIATLRADLAYHDRQAAQHDATGRVAGHAEQCGCHGCATGPLRVEVERLREALEKYGRHGDDCETYLVNRPVRDEPPCTCGLAGALKP